MEPPSVSYVPSHENFLKAQLLAGKKIGLYHPWAGVLTFVVAAVIFAMLPAIHRTIYSDQRSLLVVAAAVAVVFLFNAVVVTPLQTRHISRRLDALVPSVRTTLTADAAGLACEDAASFSRWDWSRVHGVVDVPTGQAILAGHETIFVPAVVNETAGERDAFMSFVRSKSTAKV